MPVVLDRIDGGGGAVTLDKIDAPAKKPILLDTIEPDSQEFPNSVNLTHIEQDEADTQDRRPSNQAEIDRGLKDAPTPEARQAIEEERDRINTAPTAAAPRGAGLDGRVAPAATAAPNRSIKDSTSAESLRAPAAAVPAVQNQLPPAPARPAGVNRPVSGPTPAAGTPRPVAAALKPPKAASVGLRPPADLYYDPKSSHAIERRLATDVVPGLVETGVGGLYNMYAGGLSAVPAAIAAAFPDESDKTSSYIDRFVDLHRDMSHSLEYEARTDTGKAANEYIGKAVEWGLDVIGDVAYNAGGPAMGAYVKGASAALLALAGMKGGLGLKPEKAIDRTMEPKFDPLTSDVADPRPEPTGAGNVLRPRFDEARKDPRQLTEIEIIGGGGTEPSLTKLPDVPIPRSEKPRIRLTPEQVTGRTLPGQNEVSTPMASAAFVEPERTVSQTTPNRDAPVPRGADPVLDKAVPVDLFDPMFKMGGDPVARPDPSPTAVEGVPERAAAKADELPPAPGPATTPEQDVGYTTPDPDAEYTAFRQIASDSRKGGTAGGTQYVKLPQNLLWKGLTGKVDAALFDAGKQFKTESTDPKVRADATANKAKAFDKLQEQLRYLMFEDKSIPAEAKAPYREFLTDDGTQISRDKLIRGATGYNVRVSTIMKNARRANEGQGVAIEVPSWRGKGDMPTPEGSPKPAPRRGPDDLPQAPKPLPKKREGAAGIDYNRDSLLTAIRKLGGIDKGAVLDITGESKVMPDLRQVFTDKGKSIDDMVAQLADEGYIPAGAAADVDGGVQWLRDAVRAEADGEKSYSAKGDEDARFAAMRDEFGPGTLGAFGFNPTIFKRGLKAMANALDRNTPKAARGWMDAAQGARDVALPGLGTAWAYARKVAAAKQAAEHDIYHKTDLPTLTRDWNSAMTAARVLDPNYMQTLARPTTVREVIQQTELARRHTAKIEMHREALASGMASPVPLPGYSRVMLEDMLTKSGRPLWVLNEAKPIFEQMVGAHDVAAQTLRNKSLLGAAEALNHASVGVIMIDPMFHALTVAGRAAPFVLNKAGGNSVLFKLGDAGRLLQDRDAMYQLFKERGYQPMRVRQSMNALGGQMGTVEKIFRDNGLGKPYDFWHYVHNKIMVGTVNRIQAAVYLMKVDDLLKDGFPRDVAETSASRFANMIGGNLPKEEMNAVWHQILGASLFSRGYTSTVVRQTTRAIVQDKILMAALQRKGYSPDMVAKAVDAHRADLAKALMLDYFVMQATGNIINYAMTADVEDRNGKVRRHWAFENKPRDRPMGTKPDASDYLFPDRIAIGKTKDGTQDLYMENPLRTTRDQFLFFMQGKELAAGEKPRWLSRKIGTVLGLAEDTALGEQRGGRPMRDSLDVAANVADRMTPFDFRSAAEATRLASFDYFTDALSSALSDPVITGLKVIGLQPHPENPDPTAAASRKVQAAQNKVWAEAAEIRSHWDKMGEGARAAAVKRMEAIGPKVGIKEHTLERYMSEQEATKGQRKRARQGEEIFE